MNVNKTNLDGLGNLNDLHDDSKPKGIDDEEMFEELGLDDDEKKKSSGKRSKTKGPKSGQPKKDYLSKSAAFLDGELSNEDLTFDFKGLQQKKSKALSQKVADQFKAGFHSFVDDLEHSKTRASDLVVLSQQVVKKRKKSSSKQPEKTVVVLPEAAVVDPNEKFKKRKQIKLNQQTVIQQKQSIQKEQVTKQLQQYSLNYMSELLKPDQKKKEKAASIRSELDKQGLPTKQLRAVEGKVQTFVKKELRQQVKQDFIESLMFFDKGLVKEGKVTKELYETYKRYMATAEFAKSKGAIDEEDLNGLRMGSKSELRSFVSDELDGRLIHEKLKGATDQELADSFDKLSALATNAQFDAGAYTQSLQQKMEDFGLNKFISPYMGFIDSDLPDDSEPVALAADVQQDGADTDEGRESAFGSEDLDQRIDPEAREILTQLYVSTFTETGWMTKLKLKKFIKGIESKLPDASVFPEIRKHAQEMAASRFVEQLQEALRKKSTLDPSMVDDIRLNRKMIKSALSGLKRCGVDLSQKKLKQYQHQANRDMFPVLREQYASQLVYSQNNPNSLAISKEVDRLYARLCALKEESGIQSDIHPTLFNDSHLGSSDVSEAV